MPPKRSDVLGDATPSGGETEKKKGDTTPAPMVDKDITPSQEGDDKKAKKKDTEGNESPRTGEGTSRDRTRSKNVSSEVTELGEGRRRGSVLTGKRKDIGGPRRRRLGAKSKQVADGTKLNKSLKKLKQRQKRAEGGKKHKHPRSLEGPIQRIMKSLNEAQEADGLPKKQIRYLPLMIFDSFGNDLADKVIAAAVELVKNTRKRQLGSSEIKAAMKLVLPPDMSDCAEEAVQASLANYKETSRKYMSAIKRAKDAKKAAADKKA